MGLVVKISITGQTQHLRRADCFTGQLWLSNDNGSGLTPLTDLFCRSTKGRSYLATPNHCVDYVATKWEQPLQFFFSTFKYYFVHGNCFFACADTISGKYLWRTRRYCLHEGDTFWNILYLAKNITTMAMWTVRKGTFRLLSLLFARKKYFHRWSKQHDTLSTPIYQNN